jgi:hypothetical protein
MVSQGKMNALEARKRRILDQSDSHRQIIEGESRRIAQRVGRARIFFHQKRWWLLGGAAVGGFLLAPIWRDFSKWVPLIPDLARAMRRDGPIESSNSQ